MPSRERTPSVRPTRSEGPGEGSGTVKVGTGKVSSAGEGEQQEAAFVLG